MHSAPCGPEPAERQLGRASLQNAPAAGCKVVDLLQGNCEYEPAIKVVKKGPRLRQNEARSQCVRNQYCLQGGVRLLLDYESP